MANKSESEEYRAVAGWTKRCFLAGRSAMEKILRPYDLGSTQWYVLHRLAESPTMQRELVLLLQVERATLSTVVGALVKKGLVEQVADRVDQRQKLLRLTAAGTRLWKKLPDLTSIHSVAFEGIAEGNLKIVCDVLRTATTRLEEFTNEEK